MSDSLKRLYDLLPRYVRFRDDYVEGKPLESLMAALEVPFRNIEANIDLLYRNWFVETCDLWVVPYIADLLGFHYTEIFEKVLPNWRRLVGNTISYRRRKGTAATLSQVATAATGWPCHVVEYRETVATVPSLRGLSDSSADQVRPYSCPPPPHSYRSRGDSETRCVDLRRYDEIERLGTPFNVIDHTADLRLGKFQGVTFGEQGAFNLNTLEIAFWRLGNYPVRGGAARRMTFPDQPAYDDRTFTFHPFGIDTPLINWPQAEDEPVFETERRHLPAPLHREMLARELKVLSPDQRPPFRILLQERVSPPSFRAVESADIRIVDLANWSSFLASNHETEERDPVVAVDPVLGRMAFFSRIDPSRQVRVDYSYGASADIGGGPYSRRGSLVHPTEASSRKEVAGGWADLKSPIHPFASVPGQSRNGNKTLIRITDSGIYDFSSVHIRLRPSEKLTIEADEGCCPVLCGSFTVSGNKGSRLRLNGLWIDGTLNIQPGAEVDIEHCTVNPPRHEPRVAIQGLDEGEKQLYSVRIRNSILGSIYLSKYQVALLEILDSVVDGAGHVAIGGLETQDPETRSDESPPRLPPAGPPAHLERSTILGKVAVHQLWLASNVLFTGRVLVERPRDGRMRFCYVPWGSIVPRRHATLTGPPQGEEQSGDDADANFVPPPTFTSTRYGDPGYVQLTPCNDEISHGGDNGEEIGVYHSLAQSYRLATLPYVLRTHLPRGFDARASFIT